MERLRAEDALNKKATGTRQLVDTSEAPVAAPKPARKTADSDGDTDSDLDDENDEAIFAQYKQQRVADIQATLPRYGVHARVDVTQLTTIVKHENPYVYVVVHLYQNVRSQFSLIATPPVTTHCTTTIPHTADTY